jgi:hypothetical protein
MEIIEESIGIQFTSLDHVDHDANKLTKISIDNESKALGEYIERLVVDIKQRNSKRSFKFSSETTEVRLAIHQMINGNFEIASKINSQRLLNVEISTQETMNKLGVTLQKGSLFQTVINVDDEIKMIIIGKADHNEFLDADDMEIHNGLPWKKKIFKSFMAMTDYEGNVLKVFVSDTSSAITKYWWSDFLELTEVRTDSHNTKKFLEIVDRKVFNPMKKEFPADHTILRNSLIGYFRSNDSFDLDDLHDSIFDNYVSTNDKLDLDKISKKIKEIPDKYNIDSSFDIDKKEINKRSVNSITLNEGIELILKGAPDLSNIKPFKDEEGNKFIQIKSDEGFNRFKE